MLPRIYSNRYMAFLKLLWIISSIWVASLEASSVNRCMAELIGKKCNPYSRSYNCDTWPQPNKTITCSNVQMGENDVLVPRMIINDECATCPVFLEIVSSYITIIPSSAFSNFPKINKLILKNLGINVIKPGAFNSLPDLQELYLSHNDIADITFKNFNHLSKLQLLDISYNDIKMIEDNTFNGIKITTLNLSSNYIARLNEPFFNEINTVEVLDLRDNKLTMFNFTLASSHLRHLNISSNLISEIDGCLKNIYSLNLSHNKLTSVDKINCHQLSNIQDLDISYNLISDLPADIFQYFPDLQRLYLQHNQIASIPSGSFSNLKLLNILNMSHCQIVEILDDFHDLEKLEILDFSDNKLSILKGYRELPSVKELYIQNNAIVDFNSKHLLLHFPELQQISLYNNVFFCDDLVEMLYILQTSHIRIIRGQAFNTSNILGIACTKLFDNKFEGNTVAKADLRKGNVGNEIRDTCRKITKFVDVLMRMKTELC